MGMEILRIHDGKMNMDEYLTSPGEILLMSKMGIRIPALLSSW